MGIAAVQQLLGPSGFHRATLWPLTAIGSLSRPGAVLAGLQGLTRNLRRQLCVDNLCILLLRPALAKPIEKQYRYSRCFCPKWFRLPLQGGGNSIGPEPRSTGAGRGEFVTVLWVTLVTLTLPQSWGRPEPRGV